MNLWPTLVLALLVGCTTKPNPSFCDEDGDCRDGFRCDLSFNGCVPDRDASLSPDASNAPSIDAAPIDGGTPDAAGVVDAAIPDAPVANQSPTAVLTATPPTAFVNQPVFLDARDSYDPDGTLETIWIDPGDGSGATKAATRTRQYVMAGAFTATAIVVDDDGASDIAEVTVVISP